jgi:hypothetical protein
MADRRTAAAKKGTTTRKGTTKRKAKPAAPRRQAAATPKPRGKTTAPRPQRSRRAAPARRALPADLVEHFGGDERVELILAECVPQDASPADELRLLLEARRLGADPLRRDVYLARGVSRDGSDFEYSVAARRDALLRFAEQQPDFAGHDEAAIYSEDEFAHGDPEGEGDTLRKRAGVRHVQQNPAKRGELVGAWCAVERRGRPPLVFVATATEYLPPEDVAAMEPDDPRRRYPDRYLVKAAMCWPLRMLYGLNDVVGAEELREATVAVPVETREVLPPAADELGVRIAELYAEAKRIDLISWTPAKIRARLTDADDQAREELAADLGRLAELREFDREDVDEDTLAELDDEIVRLEALAEPVVAAA